MGLMKKGGVFLHGTPGATTKTLTNTSFVAILSKFI